MVLRSLLAATALLTAACFVDNQPIDASASVAASDPASSTTAGPTTTTTTGATGLPASTTGEPTSSGTGEPGTTTTTAATTTPVTTDPATTDPATTGAAEPCASLPELGGALTLPACAACVQAHCCEPFDTCAGSDTCTKAWACISAEPCQSKWLQCPGVGEAAAPLKGISDCTLGPCADECLVPCTPQTSACANDPACSALESCLNICAGSCLPGDNECLADCNGSCIFQHADGFALWQAKTDCLGTVC